MFGLMEKRYMRYNKILEEMTAEEGLDIMLALLTAKTASQPAPTTSITRSAANSRPTTSGKGSYTYPLPCETKGEAQTFPL